MDIVRENDQCLYYVSVTIILMADTKEELDSMTETVETRRTMLTQSLAVLMSFNVQELNDKQGCYYGINQVSKNINIGNRKRLINGNERRLTAEQW